MNLVDETEEVDEKHLKVIIIGDSLVGKSSLLKDTADSEFKDLNEIHFALLRKTTPIANVNITEKFLGDDSTYKVKTLNTWPHEEHVSIHHAKTVLLDALSAMKALHSMDILHNDIKGDNVIVKQSDHDLFSGYLIDLGNASTTFLSAIYDFGQTERDYYDDDPLSIHYAPELIFDNAATTRASDVYQIGQLIYIMGNDMGNEDLRDIGERCLYREPLSRIKLLDLIEFVSQL
ncbi:uncharacterized protein LOC115924192 [Strongylocentrotus purpuratus]|uniref:Protein kinase domain-containing protein n=1 Tax=Strongylocentrotus purpuratus TaxID=7668 RepID=A0A7M7SZ30_STRPU|nr:uncharacterized protein LOC115924192 [Strongylocentrotus purpuratus]